MDRVLATFWVLTLGAYGLFALIRPPAMRAGLSSAGDMLLQALPWMVVSMLAAGLGGQFIHPSTIARLLGRGSGLFGILLGALLGVLGTGSRWAVYPLAAGLLASQAGLGAVFAFMTSWQLVSLPRLPAEVPFFGLRFALIRAVVSFVIAVIGGILVDLVAGM